MHQSPTTKAVKKCSQKPGTQDTGERLGYKLCSFWQQCFSIVTPLPFSKWDAVWTRLVPVESDGERQTPRLWTIGTMNVLQQPLHRTQVSVWLRVGRSCLSLARLDVPYLSNFLLPLRSSSWLFSFSSKAFMTYTPTFPHVYCHL